LCSTPSEAKEVFGFESVSQLAKKAADEAFRAPPSIPDFLKTISYDEYRDIRFEVKESLWKDRRG